MKDERDLVRRVVSSLLDRNRSTVLDRSSGSEGELEINKPNSEERKASDSFSRSNEEDESERDRTREAHLRSQSRVGSDGVSRPLERTVFPVGERVRLNRDSLSVVSSKSESGRSDEREKKGSNSASASFPTRLERRGKKELT